MTSQRVRDRLVERLRDGASNGQGIADERVLNVIRTLPRHLFDQVVNEPVPDEFLDILRRADARASQGDQS